MIVLLGTVFVASLLGSLHCVGMCGPFALLAGANSERKKSAVVPTLAYSGGRLVTYSIVGLVFGSLGLALNNSGMSFASWQQTATYVAGGLMILVGVISLARYFGVRIKLPRVFSPMQRLLQSGFARTKALPPVQRAFAIGALTSLMPCGWLYTFAITAAGTGSPIWGVVVMAVFWVGTVPIMAALMLGVDRIGTALQKRLPVVMASLVILIGLFTLVYRAPVAIGSEPRIVSGMDELTQQLSNVDHESLPCCQTPDEAKDGAKK
jgi:sulfite exporter TauE/SafE